VALLERGEMTFITCKCCGSEVYVGTGETRELCHLCETRNMTCLHNMSEHLGKFHYSRVHEETGGEPESCQYCLSRLIS
jgi:hypothetical protein